MVRVINIYYYNITNYDSLFVNLTTYPACPLIVAESIDGIIDNDNKLLLYLDL